MPTPELCRISMQSWLDQNPLRQWRLRWKISRKIAAHLLQVSGGTVQNWESGLGQPQALHFERLGGENNWAARWKAWIKQKPETEAEQKTA